MQHYFVLAASDFPVWLRITHYINLLFMFLLIRGLQILMAHPRLYWSDMLVNQVPNGSSLHVPRCQRSVVYIDG